MRAPGLLSLLAWLFLAVPVARAQGEPPARVVSMNLCTDQLAMLLAADGQLHSVSHVATDPRSSAMALEARDYVLNHGLAEEIFLMQPDLVIAGQYSARSATAMLTRLGIPVAILPDASSFAEVRDLILRMGEVLHREEAAREMAAEFDARLERLRRTAGKRPDAVLYYANGYTAGDRTLAGQILLAAGFANAAADAGYDAGMKLPLEVLAMTDPDALITSRPYPRRSRAEEVLDHPAVLALRANRTGATVIDQDWVCGTPFVLRAVEELSQARRAVTGKAE